MIQLEKTCPDCQTVTTVAVSMDGYAMWAEGNIPIQEAFPTLSAELREVLKTGTCTPCWDVKFPDEDDGRLPGTNPDDLWYPGVF